MFLEWLLVVLLLTGVGLALIGKSTSRTMALLVVLLMAAGSIAAWLWQKHLRKDSDSRARLTLPRLGRPEEYAGSTSCRACHPDQYATWHCTFHRTMTQIASAQSVRASFDQVALHLDGEDYHLKRRGDEFWVEMADPSRVGPGSPRVERRMTMVTGSHHMQAYWLDNQHGNQQLSFPFTYLFEQERWVPRRSVFLLDPRQTNWAQIWNVGCIDCHSTAGQPRQLKEETQFDSRVAELGIACEACHGPAAKHVRVNSDPLRRYRLHFQKNGDDGIVNPAKLSSKRSSEVCGRCHSIHSPRDQASWLQSGEGYRPGDDLEAVLHVIRRPKSAELRRSSFWNDGMIRVSGREYNGLVNTPCFQKGTLSCLSCHSMHQSSPTNQLAKTMDSNAACVQCHQSFEEKLVQHTHHAANSSGSLCYNCHMPYTSYGLLKALRSHQISSPSVRATVQTGRPNACNLCHLDKTLAWTAQSLANWFKTPLEPLSDDQKRVAASILWTLQGDAGQRALIAWHMGWAPALATSNNSWFAPYLAALLQDPYPAVRYIAGRSLKRIPGFEAVSYDYIAAPEQLQRSGQAVLDTWLNSTKPGANASLLLDANGHLDEPAAYKLLQSRNDRVVELNE